MRRTSNAAGLLVCAFLASQCESSQVDGRDWVQANRSVRLELVPDGVLHIDRGFHPIVKQNYASYIGIVAKTFKDKHLFNRNPVPLIVYFMPDAATVKKYCPTATGAVSTFVPGEGAIYVHTAGAQLVDNGVGQALIRDIVRATIHDTWAGDFPAWIDAGITRFLADGAFGPNPEIDGPMKIDWFVGVPRLADLAPLLGGDLPDFPAVRAASRQEFARMGAKGVAVATAATYLLQQLEQLRNLIWQIRPVTTKERTPEAVLSVLHGLDPRYAAHFADPAAALFKMRPDFKVYLECEQAGASEATLQKSRANAEAHPGIGTYWWQYVGFLKKLGKGDDAIVAALRKCRAAKPHRDQNAVLAALATHYHEKQDWAELEPVVTMQLRSSVLPTPTMFRRLADARKARDEKGVRDAVKNGLGLPVEGFAADVARLRQLAAELKED